MFIDLSSIMFQRINKSCHLAVEGESEVRRYLPPQRTLRHEVVQWWKNIDIESSWKNIILCVGLKFKLLLTGKVAIFLSN